MAAVVDEAGTDAGGASSFVSSTDTKCAYDSKHADAAGYASVGYYQAGVMQGYV